MKELNKLREEVADQELHKYDFYGYVEDSSNWVKDGDVWSCKVYLENEDEYEEEGTTIPYSFTVFFEEGTTEVESVESECLA